MSEPFRNTRKCAVCGKEFIVHKGAGWLYRKVNHKTGKTEYYCGYNCARKAGWKG